ncbi:acetylserotonin O-methyltransferase-like [Rutidosis leptorrhynchoides]|uniref:acetylserotonin O-methyltransferase-like n=1 Tax=Rutidosis leptorrhynchoides TaxID=125765 RepID=UPI003A9A2BA2
MDVSSLVRINSTIIGEKIEKINSKKEEDQEAAALEEIWKYILGFTPMALIKCAIEIGIPDILENRETPMTLAELTSELGCSKNSGVLYRIMRFLMHYKIFQEKPISETSVGYVHTPLSRLLTRNGKYRLADLLLFEASPAMLDPWHKLSGYVLDNTKTPFKAAHDNIDIWGFCAANPEHSKLLYNAMACDARIAVAAVLKACPEVFEGVSSLVDVGGGDGTALRLIVEACPWIKGINYVLPHVISVAPSITGVEHVAGDMFDHVPKADAVYLMKLLPDSANEQCIKILKKCKEAIPEDAKISLHLLLFYYNTEYIVKNKRRINKKARPEYPLVQKK